MRAKVVLQTGSGVWKTQGAWQLERAVYSVDKSVGRPAMVAQATSVVANQSDKAALHLHFVFWQ